MLKEFEVGKTYRVMGYEELSKFPGVIMNSRGSLIGKPESSLYTIDMDRYVKDMVFNCDNNPKRERSIDGYLIEPWMCEEVTDTFKKVDNYKPLKQALVLISNYCDGSECDYCPMANADGECVISTITPCDWDITERVQILR